MVVIDIRLIVGEVAADAAAERLLQDALVEARRHLGADHTTTYQIRHALMAGSSAHEAVKAREAADAPDAPSR